MAKRDRDLLSGIIFMLLSTYMNLGSKQTKTNDKKVRESLIHHLKGSEDSSVIFEEFDIERGRVRADVVSVSGSMVHGFEIKSDVDTLTRLPNQVKYYNQVFSTVTLVVGSEHVVKALHIIPDWWGVMVATQTNSSIVLNTVRGTKRNDEINVETVANLLHRKELVEILNEYAPGRTYSGMSKPMLKTEAMRALPFEKLYTCLSNTLAQREKANYLRV